MIYALAPRLEDCRKNEVGDSARSMQEAQFVFSPENPYDFMRGQHIGVSTFLIARLVSCDYFQTLWWILCF